MAVKTTESTANTDVLIQREMLSKSGKQSRPASAVTLQELQMSI